MVFVATNGSLSVFEQVQAANPGLTTSKIIQWICERLLDEAEAKPPVNVEMLASLCGIASVERRFSGPAGHAGLPRRVVGGIDQRGGPG